MILDRERDLVPSSACGGGPGRGHNEEVNYQVCVQAPKPPSQPFPAPQGKGQQSHAS